MAGKVRVRRFLMLLLRIHVHTRAWMRLFLCAWLFPAVASFLFACLCGFRFLRVSFDFYYKMLVFVDENYYICNI
jgi:hypothetical protein